MADLVDDLAEIRLLLHERQFELIATKSGRVRGRIVRLKRRIYNDLDPSSREALDRARDLLEDVADEALNRRTIDETKIERIQRALSDADEAFNLLLGQLEPQREE